MKWLLITCIIWYSIESYTLVRSPEIFSTTAIFILENNMHYISIDNNPYTSWNDVCGCLKC